MNSLLLDGNVPHVCHLPHKYATRMFVDDSKIIAFLKLDTLEETVCLLELTVTNTLMSRIECKYCLISISYLAALFDIFILRLIKFDRTECVLVSFYQYGHFVMLIMRNLNLISI